MYPWGDAQATAHAVGDTVLSGKCRGTVVSVDGDRMQILWDDAKYGPVTYPVEAEYITKAMPTPWQTT